MKRSALSLSTRLRGRSTRLRGRIWWLWLVLAALVLGCVPTAKAYSVVVLDAGHGGSDPGACWYGLRERNLTLDVAKRVEVILKRNGVSTLMTRRTDRTVSLDSRAALANRHRNSLLVSIHFNAARNRAITGHETFYRSSRGRNIALTVQRAMSQKVRSVSRGVKNRRFAVLTRTKGPAILVECGFISNRSEASRCATAAHRQRLAEGIANGILRARRM